MRRLIAWIRGNWAGGTPACTGCADCPVCSQVRNRDPELGGNDAVATTLSEGATEAHPRSPLDPARKSGHYVSDPEGPCWCRDVHYYAARGSTAAARSGEDRGLSEGGWWSGKTVAEIVHEFAVIRGDLTEQYARDQLVSILEARIAVARTAQSEGVDRVEWGALRPAGDVVNGTWPTREAVEHWIGLYSKYRPVRRTVTTYAPVVGPWEPVEENDRG